MFNVVYLVGYLILLVLLVVLLYRKKVNVEEYLVYGRGGGVFEVSMSLVALVFGASSVFGLAGWGYKFGWNAIWWTLSGVIFLVLLSFFVKVIYSLKGYTIIDIISNEFGKEVKVVSSIILFLAWVAVLAGQLIAGANIVGIFISDKVLATLLFVFIFGFYTFFWGQAAIIKTSFLQVILMVFGIALLIYGIFSKNVTSSYELMKSSKFGFDESFNFSFWLTLFISVGLSYFFGPDIYSRIFSSKDEKSARLSILLSSLFIIIIASSIVLIGIISRSFLGTVENPDNIIPLLSLNLIPTELKPIIFIALVSIPLSGADIILLTSTTILLKSIFGELSNEMKINSIWLFRVGILFVIILSSFIAIYGKSIMNVLLTSYKIFSSVVVPVIFVSLLSRVFNFKLYVGNLGKGLIMLVLLLSSFYIVIAEVFVHSLRFDNYSLYLLIINILITSVACLLKV
ncbi:MAG: sodium:solute symporter family protein [Brevinematia bacterium]